MQIQDFQEGIAHPAAKPEWMESNSGFSRGYLTSGGEAGVDGVQIQDFQDGIAHPAAKPEQRLQSNQIS